MHAPGNELKSVSSDLLSKALCKVRSIANKSWVRVQKPLPQRCECSQHASCCVHAGERKRLVYMKSVNAVKGGTRVVDRDNIPYRKNNLVSRLLQPCYNPKTL